MLLIGISDHARSIRPTLAMGGNEPMRLPTTLAVGPAHVIVAGGATTLALVLALADAALKVNLALVVGAAALATGILLLRKQRLSEFCPEVLAGDVILPRA